MTATRSDARPQTVGAILRAEIRRNLASRRSRLGLLIIGTAAVLGGLAVLAFVNEFDPEGIASTSGTVPTAIELTGGMAAILLGLHALSKATAETRDGTVMSALLLVPDRRRLLLARAGAIMVISAAVGVGSALVTLVFGIVSSGGQTASMSLLTACVIATAAAVPLTALLGFVTGTLVRRGALGMLLALTAVAVLPLATGVAQIVAPQALAPLLQVLLQAMPGTAIMQAVSVVGTEPGGLPAAIGGLAILGVWTAVVGLGALIKFRQEGLAA